MWADVKDETFPHIRLIYDGRFPHKVAQILPGDYYVSKTPMVAYTVLGSCISACILDPVTKIGGMNHFMLPSPKGDGRHDSWGESARYGNYAMEMLINEIMKRGGQKDRLEVKIFGGAKLYESSNNVGLNNIKFALNFIKTEGLNLLKHDTGDLYPRKIYYFTETGRVLMKKITRMRNSTVLEREKEYEMQLQKKKDEAAAAVDDVTLF